jgi:hypothetical protein
LLAEGAITNASSKNVVVKRASFVIKKKKMLKKMFATFFSLIMSF